ncbi:D-alanyl-D-alanine carboxypeptidase [Streptomyces sp. NRRL S-87]|uniref:D-alanyl-D-alanine carboxypeptidase n=1 Tax=Streptomyces sp. NRRL S-87 TaxID=1463920 RepID=UPI000B1E6211|nr:serine hydrolase [Streptomyces sp. NRRL S-87]
MTAVPVKGGRPDTPEDENGTTTGPEPADRGAAGDREAPSPDSPAGASTPTAGTDPEAADRTGSEPEAAAEAHSDASPEAEHGPEPEPEPAAAADATPAGTAPEADDEPPGDAPPTPSWARKAGGGAVADATTATVADTPRDAVDAGTDTDTDTDAGADAGADARTDTDTDAGTATAISADGGAEADPGADTDAGTKTDTDAGADTGTDAAADAVGTGKAGTGAVERDVERTSTLVPLRPLDDTGRPAVGRAPASREPVAAAVPEATTEQPLPPLDLLAQLTNTPPPAETTTRTLVRRVKVWTPLLALLVGVFAVVQAVRPLPDPHLTTDGAASSVTLDGRFDVPWPKAGQGAVRVQGSGTIGTFGAQKPVPTASVAKVMTAYVILRNHPLKKNEEGPQIEVDAKAVQDGTAEHESRIVGLEAGSEFSEQDMLKMLMIPSANNVARLLARWDTGSDDVTAFVAKMNAAAEELGMTGTTYTDPSGLDSTTVSTATDQLKLARAVMEFDVFRQIVAMPSARIKGLAEPIINNNGDLLLAGLSIKGIKTGSSTPAGGALMWAAYKTVGDRTPLILGTLMDQHVSGPDPNGGNSLTLVKDNSKKIIEAVRGALASAVVVKKGQVVGYLDDRLGGRTPLVATRDATVIGVPGQKLALTLGTGGKGLPHEAKAGTVVGSLTVGPAGDATVVPVAVRTDLVAPSFGTKLTRTG